jgi:hypothetical protein
MPVNVTGVKQLQKAMRKVEPELNKQMSQDIKTAMLIVRDKARGYLPQQNEVLSGWAKPLADISEFGIKGYRKYRSFPSYDYSLSKKLIKYNAGSNKTNRSGYKAVFYVSNVSAPGAIFETAGRKNRRGSSESESLNPNAGIQFIESAESISEMKGEGKQKGRLIYRAWFEESNRVIPSVIKAINTVAIDFNDKTKLRKAA